MGTGKIRKSSHNKIRSKNRELHILYFGNFARVYSSSGGSASWTQTGYIFQLGLNFASVRHD